jgi:UDP-sugar transporter A1/2/3
MNNNNGHGNGHHKLGTRMFQRIKRREHKHPKNTQNRITKKLGTKFIGMNTTILLLTCLVLLENANVILTRYTRESGKENQYEINHFMLVTEATKFAMAFLLETYRTYSDNTHGLWHLIKIHNFSSYDGLKVALPATLYFVQNSLFVVALSNLSTPVFQSAYQSKIIVTALVSVVLLGRSYSLIQWVSLALLSVGVTIVVLEDNDDRVGESPEGSTPWIQHIGIIAVLSCSLCSALAGVLFEKYVKRDETADLDGKNQKPSLWMRNIQLAVFSSLCACAKELFEASSSEKNSFLSGFTEWVWFLIFLRASTGLLVAIIIRRMDNVVKVFTSGVSIVVGIFGSSLVFDTQLTQRMWLGVFMVVTAGYAFGNKDPWLKLTNRSLWVLFCVLALLVPLQFRLYMPVEYLLTISSDMMKPLSPVPANHKEDLHFYIHTPKGKGAKDCGGCKVLVELHNALQEHGYHSSQLPMSFCPKEIDIPNSVLAVVVHPEVSKVRCTSKVNGTKILDVRWILAPVGVFVKKQFTNNWGSEDMIFNYATSTGVDVPLSNVLQVIVNPLPGDETDISDEIFYSKNRSGIVWTMRKGLKFHDKVTYIHEQPGMESTEFGQGKNIFSVESLRRYEYFVTYDPYTYWSWFAAMSGTVSVVYPLANMSKAEWAMGTFVGSYLQHIGSTEIPGIAYGWEQSEIEYARRTMHLLRPMLLAVKEWGANETVPLFARDVYRYKNGERTRFEGALLKRDVYPFL